MLTRAKFESNPIPKTPKLVGLYPCGNCVYCRDGYITHSTELVVEREGRRTWRWTYTRFFSCDSVNVLYVIKTLHDKEFYIGQAKNVKFRVAKHKSDVNHPKNSTCKKCTTHLRNVSGMVEPYFKFYPIFYVDDEDLRDFMERRFIRDYKPTLNGYLV